MKPFNLSLGLTCSLLLTFTGGQKVEAHNEQINSLIEASINNTLQCSPASNAAYDQAPCFNLNLPGVLRMPTVVDGTSQWTSFPAGEANQFQIVTLPGSVDVTKNLVGGTVDQQDNPISQITETNLLGTLESGFNDAINNVNVFPAEEDRLPIANTISTQGSQPKGTTAEGYDVTEYTYSPATVPFNTGPSPHVHWYDAEWFYVLEGELDLWFGTPGAYAPGETPGVNAPLEDTYHYVHQTPGQIVYTPSGTLHSFHNPSPKMATMLSLWFREPNPQTVPEGANPNDPEYTPPEGGIEQFFTHPQIGLQFDSPDESQTFVKSLSDKDTNKRLANWGELFPQEPYNVIISTDFQEYLVGSSKGTTNNPYDLNPNESVLFNYDPSLLDGQTDLLADLLVNTPELAVPESSSVLGILTAAGILVFARWPWRERRPRCISAKICGC